MRISDWSSDVCSSDLDDPDGAITEAGRREAAAECDGRRKAGAEHEHLGGVRPAESRRNEPGPRVVGDVRHEDDQHRHAAEEVEPRVADAGLSAARGGAGGDRHALVLRLRSAFNATPRALVTLPAITRPDDLR